MYCIQSVEVLNIKGTKYFTLIVCDEEYERFYGVSILLTRPLGLIVQIVQQGW